MRRCVRLALPAAAVLIAVGCATGTHRAAREANVGPSGTGNPVVVAAFNFTESQVLANLFADVLNKAGVSSTVRTLTTREVVEPALWVGQVQVVPEYTSSLLTYFRSKDRTSGGGGARRSELSHDPAATVAALRAAAGRHGVVVLNPSAAADQNSFAVTTQFARAHRLQTLSDLGRYRGPLVLGGPPECPVRPYCKPGLEQSYGITFTGFRSLDPGGPLTKLALQTGHIQVGLVFSSDPGIDAYHLTVLADDRHLQSIDVVVPVVRASVVSPRLSDALNKLMAVLTTQDLMQLNAAVDLHHMDPTTAARDYLEAKGLL